MELLRLFLLANTLLFILLERIDVRVSRQNGITVKISFIFFAIVFWTDGLILKQRKRYLKTVPNLKAILKSTRYLFLKSNVRLVKSRRNGDKADVNNSHIDILFHFSLLQLIISALILLYYIVKSKVKRVIKNV